MVAAWYHCPSVTGGHPIIWEQQPPSIGFHSRHHPRAFSKQTEPVPIRGVQLTPEGRRRQGKIDLDMEMEGKLSTWPHSIQLKKKNAPSAFPVLRIVLPLFAVELGT